MRPDKNLGAPSRSESDLLKVQADLRQKLLRLIGGLPTEKTDLHARITGNMQMDGFPSRN